MARRLSASTAPVLEADLVAAVRALEPLVVLDVDPSARSSPSSSSPSARAVLTAVEDRVEVAVARQWAEGNLTRVAVVRAAVSSLTARTYAASSRALDAPPF